MDLFYVINVGWPIDNTDNSLNGILDEGAMLDMDGCESEETERLKERLKEREREREV